MRPVLKRRLKKTAFIGFAILGVFFILEIAARIVNLPAVPVAGVPAMSADAFIVDDPEIFWLMKPNVNIKGDGPNVFVNTNNIGLRDDDTVIPKPRGWVRIVCLGESTTFGASVPQNETYAQVAEQILNQQAPPGVHYDVVNAGMSASSSFQGWQWLRRYGEELEPDWVVLYYQGNDLMPAFGRSAMLMRRTYDYTDRELYQIRNRYAGALFFFNHSYLYKTIRHLITGRLAQDMENRLSMDVREDSDTPGVWASRVPEGDRVWVWNRFREWSEKNNARMLMMNPCYISSREVKKNLIFYYAEQNNIPMMDCILLLNGSGVPWEVLFDEKVDTHPSPAAHKVMGQALADRLLKLMSDEEGRPEAK